MSRTEFNEVFFFFLISFENIDPYVIPTQSRYRTILFTLGFIPSLQAASGTNCFEKRIKKALTLQIEFCSVLTEAVG